MCVAHNTTRPHCIQCSSVTSTVFYALPTVERLRLILQNVNTSPSLVRCTHNTVMTVWLWVVGKLVHYNRVQ